MAQFQPNEAAITTRQVMREGWPILLVTHDADDGAWQFLNGRGDTDDTENGLVVGVGEILELDPSVGELADLPLGWRAWRAAPADEWRREPHEQRESFLHRLVRRLPRRAHRFSPGERVVFVPDGTTGTVNVPGADYSHVLWDDETPREDYGGSRVATADLRRAAPPE